MKKPVSHFTVMILAAAAAIALASCGNRQADAPSEMPLKVTYVIECSNDLMNFCDMVVTYCGDDGANVVDTIKAMPSDSTGIQVCTKTFGTHKIPVKIGLDYTFVPKTDTLIIDRPAAWLYAKCTIIAEKIGTRNGVTRFSERTINDKNIFYKETILMGEDIINTRSNLKGIIDIYNDRQAYKRNTTSNTCFIAKPHPYGKGLAVYKARWNNDSIN